jgi:trehalose 6-phosphate phosphatase
MHQRSHDREKIVARSPETPPPQLDIRAHALFLDLDGTLAPIVARPDMVQLSGELRGMLQRLAHAMNGALALVTGRTIADADRILGGALNNIAGVHGYEVRSAAQILHAPIDLASIAAARKEADALLRANAPGCSIEDKTASIALHFRQAPAMEPQVRNTAKLVAAKYGLHMLEGKMVIELLTSAHSKAHALELFLSEPPFAGRTPVAVGDDVTDEDAFAAAAAHGGFAVLVGEPRPSAAHYWLRDPDAVAAWLAAALERAP